LAVRGLFAAVAFAAVARFAAGAFFAAAFLAAVFLAVLALAFVLAAARLRVVFAGALRCGFASAIGVFLLIAG
jgi:hypothetical protein